jgi:SpoIID/LytB domain protein
MLNLSKRFSKILIISLLGIYSIFLFQHPVYSNTVAELEEQIAQKEREIQEKESVLEGVERRIKEISGSNYSLSQKIGLITEEINILEENIEKTEAEIEEKVKGIEEKQGQLEKTKVLIDEVSGDLYMQSRYKLANFFLNKGNWSSIVESLYIRKSTISMLKTEVEKIGGEFSSLAESKADLDREKENLDKEREGLDEAYTLLAEEKSKLQAELSKQVATKSNVTRQIGGIKREVSELQNYLLLVKSGGTIVNVESLGSGTGTGSLSYFRSNAPSGSFGVFSFGAYTHRNGMSQWGAWARSRAGQNYQQILSFYYPGAQIVQRNDLMQKIPVIGYGELDFEDYYLLGIREIHGSWNTTADMNILKAQAIIARSYAVARTNNGANSICTTESCQVFSTNFHGGAWEQAVRETRGMVLVSGGNVLSTQYAAVHGGWVNNVGYDLRSNSGSWIAEAWDNISGVSWFYRNWHTKGYTTQTCFTQPNPWLSNAHMADILNAYLYWTHESISSDSRVTALDIAQCWGQTGSNPYSMSEMKARVSSVGRTPVNSVSSVITSNGNGSTTSIVFTTDAGRITVNNPAVFKEVYNMRAPAFFAIPQTGFIHINIEMK